MLVSLANVLSIKSFIVKNSKTLFIILLLILFAFYSIFLYNKGVSTERLLQESKDNKELLDKYIELDRKISNVEKLSNDVAKMFRDNAITSKANIDKIVKELKTKKLTTVENCVPTQDFSKAWSKINEEVNSGYNITK